MAAETGQLATFDPDRYEFVAGNIPATGGADGVFFEVEPLAEEFKSRAGIKGRVTRLKVLDKRHRFKLRLDAGSPYNAYLTILRSADGATGKGMFPIVATDGLNVWMAPIAWIAKSPTASPGDEVHTLEWEFECTNCVKAERGG